MDDRRSKPRFVLGLACTIRVRGGTARATTLIDIAQGGCRVETMARLHAGEMVWLSVGPVKGFVGTIAWASVDFAGVVFGSSLHDSVIDELIRLAGRPADERRRLDDLAYRSQRQAAWSQTTYEAESLQLLAMECRTGRRDDSTSPMDVAVVQEGRNS